MVSGENIVTIKLCTHYNTRTIQQGPGRYST